MPAAAAIPWIIAAASAAATVASTVEQKRASDAAANTSTQVADYNAKVDGAESAQLDLDSQANIAAMRKDAETYMSRQKSAFVGNGITASTGSALAVQVATAGKFAMQEQQAWNNANAKEEMLGSAAQAGIAEGAAKADQYHMQGVAAVISGAGRVAGQAYGAYQGGLFDSGPSGGANGGQLVSGGFGEGQTNNLSAGLA